MPKQESQSATHSELESCVALSIRTQNIVLKITPYRVLKRPFRPQKFAVHPKQEYVARLSQVNNTFLNDLSV